MYEREPFPRLSLEFLWRILEPGRPGRKERLEVMRGHARHQQDDKEIHQWQVTNVLTILLR